MRNLLILLSLGLFCSGCIRYISYPTEHGNAVYTNIGFATKADSIGFRTDTAEFNLKGLESDSSKAIDVLSELAKLGLKR